MTTKDINLLKLCENAGFAIVWNDDRTEGYVRTPSIGQDVTGMLAKLVNPILLAVDDLRLEIKAADEHAMYSFCEHD